MPPDRIPLTKMNIPMPVGTVPPRPVVQSLGLTGRTRHRVGFRGRLVLQIEHRFLPDTYRPPGHGHQPRSYVTAWRDATLADLASLYPPVETA